MAGPVRARPAWRRELAEALNYVGDHVSLYQLTIEPDTMFERLRDAGKLELPDEELEPCFVPSDAGTDLCARIACV